VREQRRAMPQVGRKQRQLVSDIMAIPVPAQQCVHGEAVPKIMNPRQLSFCGNDAAFLEQRPKCSLQTRGAISPSAPGGVPDERRIRRKRKLPAKSDVKVLLQLFDDGVVDGQQTRFVELSLSNMKRELPPIVVTELQPEQFAAADSGFQLPTNRGGLLLVIDGSYAASSQTLTL